MNIEKMKKEYPFYKKWLLVNYDTYLFNKQMLDKVNLPPEDYVRLKNATIIYENVVLVVKEVEKKGVSLTKN